MKRCPVCNIALRRVDYEGFRILKCAKCKGSLVDEHRLESLKRTRKLPAEQLAKEAMDEAAANTEFEITCPGCRGAMRKHVYDFGFEVCFDFCDSCRLYWLDGGELAIVQLLYELSPKGADEEQFRKRMEQLRLSGERMRRFKERLDGSSMLAAHESFHDEIWQAILKDRPSNP